MPREHPLVVGPFVGRPLGALALHHRLGRADERRRPLEVAAVRGDGREAADLVRHRPVVAARAIDLERLARERLSLVEVAELALDHAEIAGLGADGREVAGLAGHRDALRHHLAGLLEVTRHLGRDAEDVHRIARARSDRRSRP